MLAGFLGGENLKLLALAFLALLAGCGGHSSLYQPEVRPALLCC